MEDGIYDHNRILLQGVAAESPNYRTHCSRTVLQDDARMFPAIGNIDTAPSPPRALLLSGPSDRGQGSRQVSGASYNRMGGEERLILTAFARIWGRQSRIRQSE